MLSRSKDRGGGIKISEQRLGFLLFTGIPCDSAMCHVTCECPVNVLGNRCLFQIMLNTTSCNSIGGFFSKLRCHFPPMLQTEGRKRFSTEEAVQQALVTPMFSPVFDQSSQEPNKRFYRATMIFVHKEGKMHEADRKTPEKY